MPYLHSFGSYLPRRVVDNAEIAALVGVTPAWIFQASGIEQRRFAGVEETVASLGAEAARDCLATAGIPASEVGLILSASGSVGCRFPGPASAIGVALEIQGTPAIDLPLASAGSLFGIALAAQLSPVYGNVLIVASEIMSRTVRFTPQGRDTAVLFGDGAGACLVSDHTGFARIADFLLHTDGDFRSALTLSFDGPLHMDGRTVIMQSSRKLPRVIAELLDRNHCAVSDVETFLLHQANQNLITRVAAALQVPVQRFFGNLRYYGNTSSASLLIAAHEWRRQNAGQAGSLVLAAFGAGLNWGALLAIG